MTYNDLTLKADQFVRLGGIPRTREEWSDFISSWQTTNSNSEEALENFIPHLGEYIFLKDKENDKEIIKYFVGDGTTPLNEGSNLRDEIEWMTFENGKTTTDQLKDKSVTADKLNENIVAEGNNALKFNSNGFLYVNPRENDNEPDSVLDPNSENSISNQAVCQKFQDIDENLQSLTEELDENLQSLTEKIELQSLGRVNNDEFIINSEITKIFNDSLGEIVTSKKYLDKHEKIKAENIVFEQEKEDRDGFEALTEGDYSHLYHYPKTKEIKGYISSKNIIKLYHTWGKHEIKYNLLRCHLTLPNTAVSTIISGNISTCLGQHLLGISPYSYERPIDENGSIIPNKILIVFYLYELGDTSIEPALKDYPKFYIDIKYE